MVFKVFLLAAFVSLSAGKNVNVNKMADALIAALDKRIRDNHSSEVDVPNVSKKWGWGWFSNSFGCQDGKLGSLASLERTGNATLDIQRHDRMILHIDLRLGKLEANYGKCQAKIFERTVQNFNMKAIVFKNSFYAQVLVAKGRDNKCFAKLELFGLLDFGAIFIETSGFFQIVKDVILFEVAKSMRERVAGKINDIMTKEARKVIAEAQLMMCQTLKDV